MKYRTIVADPPWRFANKSGKGAPQHRRLYQYPTMPLEQIAALGPQVLELAAQGCHLYLWVPTALLLDGLKVMASWGFDYKTSLYWHKVTRTGTSDRSCMGFYYRNVVEPCLFGILDNQRTNHRNVANLFADQKTGHSVKPASFFSMVERQSEGPRLEMFARSTRLGWDSWGNEVEGAVLISTDPTIIVETWKDVVREALTDLGGRADVRSVYARALLSDKTSRAVENGHRWKAQIRRTLQRHFLPEGGAVWKVA